MSKRPISEILSRVSSKENGCLEWTGTVHKSGYGYVYWSCKVWKAHRLFFEFFKGPIPEGLYVCHKCHNKLCVNPDHLYAGTQRENMRDMVEAGRQAKGEKIAKHKRGTKNAAAKLTEAQIQEIPRLMAELGSQAAVARTLGVTDATIHRHRRALTGAIRCARLT